MKRSHENILWMVIATIAIVFSVLVINYRFSIFTLDTQKTSSSYDGYVRNISWNTDYSIQTPYKKGDVIEYLYAFSGVPGTILYLDITGFSGYFESLAFTLNDTTIDPPSTLTLAKNPSILKVRGTIKNDGNPSSIDPKNLLKILREEIPTTTTEATQSGQISDKNGETDISTKVTSISEPTSLPQSENISFDKITFSVNEDALLHMTGSGVNEVNSVIIGGTRYSPIHTKNEGYFIIPKHSFESSEQFVSFVLNSGTMVAFKDGISFTGKTSKIYAQNISPSKIDSSKVNYVILQGYGFSKTMSLQLGNGIVLKAAEFKILDDSALLVEIPKGIEKGIYTFNIMDTESVYESSETPLVIQ